MGEAAEESSSGRPKAREANCEAQRVRMLALNNMFAGWIAEESLFAHENSAGPNRLLL